MRARKKAIQIDRVLTAKIEARRAHVLARSVVRTDEQNQGYRLVAIPETSFRIQRAVMKAQRTAALRSGRNG